MRESVRVLGIDPGTAVTGWGVVEGRPGAFRHLGHGTVSPSAGLTLARKLAHIHAALVEQCATWRPDALALEKSFVGRNTPPTRSRSRSAICRRFVCARWWR